MSTSNNWPTWLPLREPLKPMSPYGAPQVPASAQLNTNENPFAPSPALIAAISKRVAEVSATLNRYPDRDAIALRAGLAKFITAQTGVTFELANLWAANGSNEIIQSIFLAFGRKSALGFTPSYSMHSLIAKVTATPWIDGTRRKDFTLDCDAAAAQIESLRPTLTFITTPNNPTGSAVLISEIEMLARSAALVGGLLVIDEAYAEFSSEKSAVTLIEKFPNIKYKNDIDSYEQYGDNFYNLFPCEINPETKKYESEDYGFSRLWRETGGEIFIEKSAELIHYGWKGFSGNISEQMKYFNKKQQQ